MNRLLKSLALALLLSTAVEAATGTVGAATTDTVTISIDGMKYASARWVVRTAGTSKLTAEITLDGVNWIPAAYSQTINTVSANPAVASWQNTTAVAASFDTPIPSNIVAFRIRCGTTGTSTILDVVAGSPYTPNRPTTAVLFDASETGTGVGLDTGSLDTSGWVSLLIATKAPGATNAVNYYVVDDAGASSAAFAAVLTVAAAGNQVNGWGPANAPAALSALPKRLRGLIAAGGTVSAGRIRLEARR